MDKKEISIVLSRAETSQVKEIAKLIQQKYKIQIIKEPQKTLVMIKVRESIKRSLFYLGEVLASECMVMINGVKGCSVQAGDDFEKVLASAVIDGALNAGMDDEFQIIRKIIELKATQEKNRAKLNGAILKSKVNFKVMGE